MSVIQKLKSFLPGEEDTASMTTYECTDCDNTFESAKSLKKARCRDCFSSDVELQ